MDAEEFNFNLLKHRFTLPDDYTEHEEKLYHDLYNELSWPEQRKLWEELIVPGWGKVREHINAPLSVWELGIQKRSLEGPLRKGGFQSKHAHWITQAPNQIREQVLNILLRDMFPNAWGLIEMFYRQNKDMSYTLFRNILHGKYGENIRFSCAFPERFSPRDMDLVKDLLTIIYQETGTTYFLWAGTEPQGESANQLFRTILEHNVNLARTPVAGNPELRLKVESSRYHEKAIDAGITSDEQALDLLNTDSPQHLADTIERIIDNCSRAGIKHWLKFLTANPNLLDAIPILWANENYNALVLMGLYDVPVLSTLEKAGVSGEEMVKLYNRSERKFTYAQLPKQLLLHSPVSLMYQRMHSGRQDRALIEILAEANMTQMDLYNLVKLPDERMTLADALALVKSV